jgi:hypothetical protein
MKSGDGGTRKQARFFTTPFRRNTYTKVKTIDPIAETIPTVENEPIEEISRS